MLGLVSVKVMTLVPPWEMGLVPKALTMVGEDETVSVAVLEAAPALPLSVVATPEVVLFQAPAVIPMTPTVIVQLDPAATCRPSR